MKKFYFTFGQAHAHAYGGRTFDKDCVVVIEAETSSDARNIMYSYFTSVWSHQYDEMPDMSYYPRGLFKLP